MYIFIKVYCVRHIKKHQFIMHFYIEWMNFYIK